MSTTTVGHVHSAGGDHAASAPGFLLRGGAVMAVALAAGLTGVLVADRLPKRSAEANPEELSAARAVQHEPQPAAAAAVGSDTGQIPAQAAKRESVGASPREAGLDAPRLVGTEHFEGDPSVWANVRKFVPFPPDEVPVLDIVARAQQPTVAPAVPDSSKGIGAPHAKPMRAHGHRHGRVRTHAHIRDSRTQAGGGAPSEVGGTQQAVRSR